MQVYFDGLVVFQIFCVVQGITTGVYLLATHKKQPSRYWLGLLLLGLTLQVIDYFLSRSGVYYRNQWLYFSPLFYSWSFGPLIYGYVRTQFEPKAKINIWHFIPVLVQALFYYVLAFQSLEIKSSFWITVHKPYTRYIEHYGTCLSTYYYLYASIQILRNQENQPKWLLRFLWGMFGFYVLAAIDPLFNQWYLPAQAPKFYLTMLVLPVFMYCLALTGWLTKPVIPNRNKSPKLTVDKVKLEQIINLMQQQQLYKDPELSLPVFAQAVNLSTNEVSQLINAGLNLTFSDFVNNCRLDDIKTRLQNGEHEQYTLLGIALEAGFRSKTTFNRVFREQLGMAPKQYLKKAHSIKRGDTVEGGN